VEPRIDPAGAPAKVPHAGAAPAAARSRRGAPAPIALAVVVVAAFITLVWLGVWQLDRLAWKEALIAATTERPSLAAVPAPGPATWPGFDFGRWDYAHVSLTGTFGAEGVKVWTALTEPKGRLGGPGYFLVVPFTTTDGWHVLVNRGFVPEPLSGAGPVPEPAPRGVVTVDGLIRRNDPPAWVTPDPRPAEGRWYSRDIATMAAHFGLAAAATAPYQVDLVAAETPAGGVPQAGESLLTFPNNHLQYALTWFGLAAALVGVVLVALLRRPPVRS
jgi:surfeit locus 1 family protein